MKFNIFGSVIYDHKNYLNKKINASVRRRNKKKKKKKMDKNKKEAIICTRI